MYIFVNLRIHKVLLCILFPFDTGFLTLDLIKTRCGTTPNERRKMNHIYFYSRRRPSLADWSLKRPSGQRKRDKDHCFDEIIMIYWPWGCVLLDLK